MPKTKKPLVIVTRKLPDTVELRMRELFDARLNPEDKPMSQAQLTEAVKTADVLVPTVTDEIDAAVLSQAGEQLKLIANFGNGVDNIDVVTAVSARHHRDQHAGRADRGYRRHDHGADPGGAAPAGRRRGGADIRQGLDRLDADLDARPPHLGQAARHHRHGADRPGGGAARPRLRPADSLSQPPPRAAAHRGGARRHLLGEPRPDAHAHGHRLGQLPAHAGDLSPACRRAGSSCCVRRPTS